MSIYAKALAMRSNGKGHKERKYTAEMQIAVFMKYVSKLVRARQKFLKHIWIYCNVFFFFFKYFTSLSRAAQWMSVAALCLK